MTEQEWLEVPVFIHGVVSDTEKEGHEGAYRTLLNLINEKLGESAERKFNNESPIFVEWGWFKSDGEDNLLAEAQNLIKKEVNKELEKALDFTINPLRLIHHLMRQVFLVSIGDMFYYVSADGEGAVRKNLFNKICDEIYNICPNNSGSNISLSFFAHSAGSVIAHDFLYHLFRKEEETEDGLKDAVDKIRRLINEGRLRIRRFYTMGSPITPLIVRAKKLVQKIVKNELLNPEDIGLREVDGLKNPRWVNFWDKDDVFSFPVSFFYKTVKNEKVVEDKYIDIGDIFPRVHGRYWISEKIAEYIAKTF